VSRRVRTTTAPVVAWWAVSIRVPCSWPGGGSAAAQGTAAAASNRNGTAGGRVGLRGPRLGLDDATGRGSAGARVRIPVARQQRIRHRAAAASRSAPAGGRADA